MNKIKLDNVFISLQLGRHENNYFICYGIVWGNNAFTTIDTKKTHIYNDNDLVCIVNHDTIIHEHSLTKF